MSSPLASLARTMARSQPNNGRLFDVLGTLPPDHRLPFASRAHRERFSEANDRRCHEYCFGRKARLLRGFQVLETDKPHHWELAVPAARTSFGRHSLTISETLSHRSRTASASSIDHAPFGSEKAARAREVIRRQTGHLARPAGDLFDVTASREERSAFNARSPTRARSCRAPATTIVPSTWRSMRPIPSGSTPTGRASPRSSPTRCTTPPSSAQGDAATVSERAVHDRAEIRASDRKIIVARAHDYSLRRATRSGARAHGGGESHPARRFMLLARCRPSQQRFRSRECRCGIPDIERVVSFQRPKNTMGLATDL